MGLCNLIGEFYGLHLQMAFYNTQNTSPDLVYQNIRSPDTGTIMNPQPVTTSNRLPKNKNCSVDGSIMFGKTKLQEIVGI
jgi:hypothetical protein